jgi:hypothetical protein
VTQRVSPSFIKVKLLSLLDTNTLTETCDLVTSRWLWGTVNSCGTGLVPDMCWRELLPQWFRGPSALIYPPQRICLKNLFCWHLAPEVPCSTQSGKKKGEHGEDRQWSLLIYPVCLGPLLTWFLKISQLSNVQALGTTTGNSGLFA